MSEKEYSKGTLVRAVGPVVDVRFPFKRLPPILTELLVELPEGGTLALETMQHVGDDVVRTVALGATDGLKRGLPVIDTGGPISVPVGKETLGRMFNVLGEPIDGKPAPDVYQKAAQRLGLEACDCAVFEDSLAGIVAAARAGAVKVALATTNPKSFWLDRKLPEERPNAIIGDFSEFSAGALRALFIS